MRTVKVYMDASAKYVLAHPGVSNRYAGVFDIIEVPDDVTDLEVVRRQNNTINATYLGNPRSEYRKTIRFSELCADNGSHMTILLEPRS
jgi:hypothetical protein